MTVALCALMAASQRGGFTPATLFAGGASGIWLDVADGSQRWTTSGGSTPAVAPDDPIGRLGDKSGNSNNFSQATSIDRPQLVSDSGYLWLLTNGANTFLNGPTLATANPSSAAYEAWAVVQFLTVDTNSASPWLNDSVLSDTAGWATIFYARTTGVIGVAGGSGAAQTVTAGVTLSDRHVLHARLTGGLLFLSVNGGTETSVACGEFGSKSGVLRIGRGFSGFANMRFGELIFRDGSVNSSLRTAVTDHLKAKWGIA